MSENDLLSNVRQIAGLLGWFHYHTHDSRRSEAGFPDLVLVRGDRLIFAELKSAKGRLTPAQADWLKRLNAVAPSPGKTVEVYLWRPVDWTSGTIDRVLARRLT